MSEMIDEQATDWLLRLNEADATAQDFDAFNAWCADDPKHRDAYNKIASLWSDLESMEPAIAGSDSDHILAFPANHGTRERSAAAKPQFGRAGWIGAIAASIACLVVFSSLKAPLYFADHSTATGQQSVIHLEDGTVGYLNTDTAIDVSFGAVGRRIELLKGEALFEVAKDPERPFEITAGNGRSVALGTAYAVRTDFPRSGATAVTVEEGIVSIRTGYGEDTTSVVNAGQQVSYSDDGTIAPVANVDVSDALAWKRGLILFDNLSLQDALAEVNRYTPGRIVLLAENRASKRVTATLSIKTLDEGLEALASTQNLTVHKVSTYLTLLY
ncbi:FecR family protein [Nisaea sp.]|uniref:FecR family protein n=3 Tax=Nisaea sp. TaxID=2024842 RepID=UPI00326333B7